MASDDRSHTYIGILAFFLPLCVIAVSLRCYVRIFVVKAFGLDDGLALLSGILFVLFGVCAFNGIAHGTGKLNVLIPPEDYPIGMMWWWMCEPVYVLTNMALKLSIVIFLLRIAVDRTQRMVLFVAIFILEIYSFYFLMLFIFQCWPVSFFWKQFTGAQNGHCINPNITIGSTYAFSALSCIADWIFSIVPVFVVWKLQMNKRSRIIVAGILACGAIASTATIVRIPYVQGLADTNNFLYSTLDVAIWSITETGIGIAASSIATLRPLVRKLFNSSALESSKATRSTPYGQRPSGYGAGYVLNSGVNSSRHRENIQMHGGISKNTGITTVVETGRKEEQRQSERNDNESVTTLKGNQGWNVHERKSADGDSDDFITGQSDSDHGIRKTVEVSQI